MYVYDCQKIFKQDKSKYTLKEMKITIDTKEDSHEEIRKLITMLKNLIGESEQKSYTQPEGGELNNLMSMFGDNNYDNEKDNYQHKDYEEQNDKPSNGTLPKEEDLGVTFY